MNTIISIHSISAVPKPTTIERSWSGQKKSLNMRVVFKLPSISTVIIYN
jgi:hypothetical protein